MPFLLLFWIIPVMELLAFAWVGRYIGLINSLVLCFVTAIIGGYFVRRQGLQTLNMFREKMNKGVFPADTLFDGLCLLVAGICLMTPGFLTDILGFSLLIPEIRTALKKYFKNNVSYQQHTHTSRKPYAQETIIEGEFEKMDDKKVDKEEQGKQTDQQKVE